jgi:Mrp family chromosome partitioning ATPase
MAIIQNTILVMSGKGGVGKTTVAVNLAVYLARQKAKVGLLDVDIHGPNVPLMLGMTDSRLQMNGNKIIPAETPHGVHVMSMAFLLESADSSVIWRGPMKHNVIKQFIEDVDWGDLDYLVIDFPPGTGDECLSAAQLITGARGAVIVSSPQQVALLDCRKAIDCARKLGIPLIGLVENMAGEMFGIGGVAALATAQNVPFLGSLTMDKHIPPASDDGKPFVLTDTTAGHEFIKIGKKIINHHQENK